MTDCELVESLLRELNIDALPKQLTGHSGRTVAQKGAMFPETPWLSGSESRIYDNRNEFGCVGASPIYVAVFRYSRC